MKRLLLTLTLFVLIGGTAHHAAALTVTPAKLEIAADPGTTLTGTVELYNEKDKPQNLYTSFENFESNDDTGTPRFIGDDDGLATWLGAPAQIFLAAQERKEVSYTISVPQDAEAGGYFAALFFGNQAPAAEGGKVSIGGRLGVLMLLRVNGDIPESGGILGFTSTDQANWYTMPPIEFVYRFSNTGGDQVSPRGMITMRNTFGVVRGSFDANPKKGSVLPQTARKFTNTWQGEAPSTGFWGSVSAEWRDFHLGWYTAELDLKYGLSDQKSTERYSFFIFPWQLVIVVLIGLGLLLFCIKIIAKMYRASIIRELERNQKRNTKQIEE